MLEYDVEAWVAFVLIFVQYDERGASVGDSENAYASLPVLPYRRSRLHVLADVLHHVSGSRKRQILDILRNESADLERRFDNLV